MIVPAPAPVSHASAIDKSSVTYATPMVKPLVSDGIVMPNQDSLKPVGTQLVASLFKIIERQSKEIASLRDSALPGKVVAPTATALLAAAAEETEAHVGDDLPLAHSEIARACQVEDDDSSTARAGQDDGDDSSSETQSTEDELPAPYNFTSNRGRPTPGLDVLTNAASQIDAKVSATEGGKRAREERKGGKGSEQQEQEQDQPPKRCLSCQTTTTPKWRCGMTLCNACGLRCIKRQATNTRNLAALRQQEMEAGLMSRQAGGNAPKRAAEPSPDAAPTSPPFAAAPAQCIAPAQAPLSSTMPSLSLSSGIVQARAVGPPSQIIAHQHSAAAAAQQMTAQVHHVATAHAPHVATAHTPNGMRHAMLNTARQPYGVAQPPVLSNAAGHQMCANAMMGNGMAQQPMFNAMGQSIGQGFLCAPMCSNGVPICQTGFSAAPMFSSVGMAPQPIFSTGMAQPLCVAQPHKLPACGGCFSSYAPSYGPCI